MTLPRNTLLQRDFLLMAAGQFVSLFGNAILRLALPLHLLRQTGSSAIFGAVSAISFLPMILLSLVGGVLADRVNKRLIMASLDALVALCSALFPALMDAVPAAPATAAFLMLLYGVSGAYQPAAQAALPALLTGDALARGNAVVTAIGTLDDLIGPAFGGVFYALWGLEPILWASAACFAAAAVMELFLRIPHRRRPRERGILRTAWADLVESLRYMRVERPSLLRATGALALFNFALSAALVVGVPVIVVAILGLSDEALGAVQAVMGLGGLLGGVLSGVLAGRVRLRHGFVFLLACSGAMLLLSIALVPGLASGAALLLVASGVFLAMAAASMFTVQLSAAVQSRTDEHLVGKVMAVMLSVAMCTHPLGQALYGALFEAPRAWAWAVPLGAAAAAALIALYARGAFARLEAEDASAQKKFAGIVDSPERTCYNTPNH